VNCIAGSAPSLTAIAAQAQDAVRGVADALSLQFMALTHGLTM
jgi:hypothetical protein